MAELADALVSGTSDRKIVEVQVFSGPRLREKEHIRSAGSGGGNGVEVQVLSSAPRNSRTYIQSQVEIQPLPAQKIDPIENPEFQNLGSTALIARGPSVCHRKPLPRWKTIYFISQIADATNIQINRKTEGVAGLTVSSMYR